MVPTLPMKESDYEQARSRAKTWIKCFDSLKLNGAGKSVVYLNNATKQQTLQRLQQLCASADTFAFNLVSWVAILQ